MQEEDGKTMTRVAPFIGTRYNPTAVGDLSKVMAPPYDVISPEMQEALYQKSPYNVVRMILGKEEMGDDEYNNKYERAASFLREWKNNGLLIDDPGKFFYIYQQEFQTADKAVHVRTGIFAAIQLEGAGKGKILAHEHTFSGPKADRLKLLRSTRCNLSPIFCLYSDPEKESDRLIEEVVKKDAPRIELKDDEGVIHRLWLMSDPIKVKSLAKRLQDLPFFIADGHHRYETAVTYCQEMKNSREAEERRKTQPWSHTLSFLTNCEADGLLILPTHRVLSAELGADIDHAEILEDLACFFDVTPFQVNLKQPETEGVRIEKELREKGQGSTAFAMVLPGGKGYYLRLKKDANLREELVDPDTHEEVAQLDVTVLHQYILPQVWIGNPEMELDDQDIFYVKDSAKSLAMLGAPTHASAVFLMNPPTMEQVRNIASHNLRMPHKSTYFYPKLLTGMVLRDHQAE